MNIGIIGLGLMGGSIAKAVKNMQLQKMYMAMQEMNKLQKR